MGRGQRVKSCGGIFQAAFSTGDEPPVLACHLTGIPVSSFILFDHETACGMLLP